MNTKSYDESLKDFKRIRKPYFYLYKFSLDNSHSEAEKLSIETYTIDRYEHRITKCDKCPVKIDIQNNIFEIGTYRNYKFVYPNDTTHFMYDEFCDELKYNFPLLLKISDDKIFVRDNDQWEEINSGKYYFSDDKIKSIEDIIKDIENPRVRSPFLFDIFIEVLSRRNYEQYNLQMEEKYNHSYQVDELIIKLLSEHRIILLEIFNNKLGFDDLKDHLIAKSDEHGLMLAAQLNEHTYSFKQAYEYVIENYTFIE